MIVHCEREGRRVNVIEVRGGERRVCLKKGYRELRDSPLGRTA